MMIQVEFWQLVTLLIAFITFAAAAAKLLLRQVEKRLSAIEASSAEWRKVERDFLEWKGQMPLIYVLRSDYVRNQTVLEAKIDAIAVRIDNLQLRETKS